MSQIVQATCPGCKGVLRIPGEWLDQPIRCKNCGTVLQARTPTTTPTPPAPKPTTPVPQAARRPAPPPPPPAGRPASPPPVAPPGPPLAAPVSAGTPFDFGHPDEEPVEETPGPRRSRRKKSGGGLGIALALGILLATAGMGWGVYAYVIKPRMDAAAEAAADSGDDEGATSASGAGIKKSARAAETPTSGFPRRAMVISIKNYLYANPIVEGTGESPNEQRLIEALSRGLRIPMAQIVHLSDGAKKEPRPPLKSVIEEALQNFLKTSRKQDRLMVFFIGHTKEIEEKPYLVPLEGELDNAATLIPLDWVYKQLADCPARQKVLVLDGNRFNPGQGEERPSSGPMGEKFEGKLKAPPAGVQVWSACRAKQQSQEFEESSLGLFLDSLRLALTPDKNQKGALTGTIQKPDDLFPLDVLDATVGQMMKVKIDRRKTPKQETLMAGKAPESGADFDRTEGPAAPPALPVVRSGDLTLVKAIMSEISLPSIKGGETTSQDVSFTLFPPFPPDALKKYEKGDLPANSPLRKAIARARAALWAASPSKPPPEILSEVQAFRQKLKVDLSVMQDRYGNPGAAGEANLKNRVFEDSKAMAPIIARLETVLDELREAGAEKDAAPPRWQANYQFILARFQAQLAFLEEYQGLLGQMRRELPPHDPNIHTGWRMSSKEKSGDAVSKKLERNARKIFTDLAKDNPQTPWEVLSKREKLTALGLEWQAY